jgi:hypothetical protein
MATRGMAEALGTLGTDPEVLDLLRKVELRTRHLAPAADEHALTVLRRNATITSPKLAAAPRVVRAPRR